MRSGKRAESQLVKPGTFPYVSTVAQKDFPAFLNSNAYEFSPAVKFETLNVLKDLSNERIV
jgi:hypothetical protein